MYIHEIGEEKNIDTMHHLCVFVSQGEEGEGVGEKRLVFVSKKISVFTDDPLCDNILLCAIPMVTHTMHV